MMQQFLLLDDSTFFLLLGSEVVVPPITGHATSYGGYERKRRVEIEQYSKEVKKLRNEILSSSANIKAALNRMSETSKVERIVNKERLNRLRQLLSSPLPQPKQHESVSESFQPLIRDLIEAKKSLQKELRMISAMFVLLADE